MLTIGGSDSGAGAGIQTDLKTLAAHAVYGTTAIAAVTAQNTTGVIASEPVGLALIREQIDAVASDFDIRAVKTGFLGSAQAVEAVAERLERWRLPNRVVDPVLVASDGSRIVAADATRAYIDLFADATLATPNLREAALLTERAVENKATMVAAAEALSDATGSPTLVTGGHLRVGAGIGEVVDVLVTSDGTHVFSAHRIPTHNVHGTGCSLASAIAARLATDANLFEAVAGAREWVRAAIAASAGWKLGAGQGPIDHFGWGNGAPG